MFVLLFGSLVLGCGLSTTPLYRINKMSEEAFKNWEEFLNPDKLKLALIQASIYLTSYEIFKNSTIEKLRDFFTNKWSLNEETNELEGTPNKDYKKKVNRNPYCRQPVKQLYL